MVCITHLVVALFLLVSSPFGVSSGLSISSRESKVSPQSLSASLLGTAGTTEHPTRGNESTKTQKIVLNTADHQHQSTSAPAATAHHVPLDFASGSSSSSNSDSGKRTVSVVKREVSPATEGDEGKVNGFYDPGLMIMSKRSAAALNKLMWALRSIDEPSTSNSYENSVEGSTNKETSGKFPKVGFRTGGSSVQFDPFPQTGLQRRGQKDRKIYLRCYFNAVSCFRRRK